MNEDQQRYRVMFENMAQGAFFQLANGSLLDVNPAALAMFGLSREQFMGCTSSPPDWRIIREDGTDLPPDQHPSMIALRTGQKVCDVVAGIFNPLHQSFAWVTINAIPLFQEGEKSPHQVLVTLHDITEHKQAEEESRTHLHFMKCLEQIDQVIKRNTDVEQMLRELVETMLSIFDCDRAWLLYPCDPDAPSFRVPFETTNPEYPGAKVLNIDIPMSPGEARNMREALESDDPVTYTDGTERPIATAKQFGVQSQIFTPVYPKLGKPWMFGMHQCSYPRIWTKEEKKLFTEITRRTSDGLNSALYIRELRKSEERFRILVNTIPDLIWLKDPEGVYLSCNKTFERLYGANESYIIGKTDYDFVDKELADFFREHDYMAMLAGKPSSNEEWVTFADDGHRALLYTTKMPLHDNEGTLVGILGVGRDITGTKHAEEERLKLESQLQQAQKMESVGRLAGGVAHDFNNMLGVILGHAEMALVKLDPSHPFFHALDEIRKAAERSANLTRQLLAFASKQAVEPKVLDLNDAVSGMFKMLRRLIGENIDFTWQAASNLWPVKIDPAQIDQILANLCINARDAISPVGKVIIKTGTRTINHAFCTSNTVAVPGEYVQLSLSDNGCGMDGETLAHIFEPFFTTKEKGKGTGLGLATVFGIVRQNNGFIEVTSKPGSGTTFNIYLPRHAGDPCQAGSKGLEDPLQRGHETILLVEDEPAILEMTTMILTGMGYVVLSSKTPAEAIRLAFEHPGEIHLLMTDVIMPEMNGLEFSKNLLSIYPQMKRLFMSGYTSDIIAQNGVLNEGVHFIQKPFQMNTLAAKLRQALNCSQE